MTRVTPRRNQHIEALEAELALLREQMERTRYTQDLLYSMILACRGSTDFHTVFTKIYHELNAIFVIDSGCIALCDPDHPQRFRAALTIVANQFQYAEDVPQDGLTRRLVQLHAPMLFQNLPEDLLRYDYLAAPEIRAAANPTSRSWLGVPLLLGADVVGVIVLQSYQPGEYNELDRELLQRLGNIVAVALENVRLDQHQRELSAALATRAADRSQELTTLNALAAELVLDHPLPVLLDRALGLLLALLQIQAGAVRLLEPPGLIPVDPSQHNLVLVAQRGFPTDFAQQATSIPLIGFPAGRVVIENRSLVINRGLRELPGQHPSPPFESLLSVPLRIGDRILGTLSLVDPQPQAFHQDQIDLAQAIGNQIAIAIENARLFADRERQIAELQAISRIGQAAGTSQDLPTLLRKVYLALRRFIPLDAFSMIIYDPERALVIEGVSIDEGQEYSYLGNQPPPPDSLTAWLIRNRRPLHLRDVAAQLPDYPELRLHIVGVDKPAAAWLGVPLFDRDEQIIGTIAVQGYKPHAFDQRDEVFMVNVARQVALHVQNVRLLTQRERQIRELNAIGQIGKLVSASYDLDEMIWKIHTILHETTHAQMFYLVICEAGSRVMSNAIFIKNGERIDIAWQGNAVPPGSLTEWILSQRQHLLFSDLKNQAAELTTLGVTPQAFGSEITARSWVGVPLLVQAGAAVGVLALQDQRPNQYDEQTVEFLNQLASHLSLAVQKVRLFEDRERQVQTNVQLVAEARTHAATAELQAQKMELVYRISSLLSSRLDRQEILDLAAQELVRLFWADHIGIMLFDDDTTVGTVVAEYPIGNGIGVRVPLVNNPIMEEFFDSGRPVCIESTETDPRAAVSREVFRQLGIVSLMILPMASRGRLIGSIGLDSYEARVFTNEEQELLMTIATAVATAAENARLFAEAQSHAEAARRRAHEMELVYRIASVLSSRIDQQEILDLASQELVHLFWADHTGTVLFDADQVWGTVVAEYPPRGALGIRVRLNDNLLIEELVRTRRPICMTDVESDPHAEVSREAFRQLGIVSIIIVPLISRDRVIGSISLDSFRPRVFSNEEQELFLTVAASIATSVENARLFAATQEHAIASERHAQRMALVNRMALVLSSHLDLQEILDLAVNEVVNLFRTDHTRIVLFDDDGQWGTVFAERPDNGARGMRVPVADSPLEQEVMTTRRPVSIAAVATDSRTEHIRAELQQMGVISMMIVPLVSRGRVIGSLGLDSLRETRVFAAEEQELLLTVGTAIAAAVENARLFAAEQEARRTADTLREVARVLTSSFNPAEVLQLILRELQHVVRFDTASIMLRDGQMLRLAAFRGDENAPRKLHRTLFKLDQQLGAGMVLSRREPLVIADTSISPDWSNANETPHVRSWLGVPLLSRGEVLGVLNINAQDTNRFTPRDMEAALAFASQAAVALENARLYQESVTRVEQELEIARRIQSNLFPRSLPLLAGFTLDARCIPARETGGDFYDVINLRDQRVAIMVGDVSGKSIPAAMLMAVARSITRSEARDHEVPQVVMCETNRWIVRDVPRRTFVALAYATLDLARRHLALSNAGQLAPILRRQDGQVTYLEPPGPLLPLGTIPNIAYDALELTLEPGDLLVFHTDGIVEAHNEQDELFGFERLEALVRDYGHLAPTQFIDRVMQAVRMFAGQTPQHDDITLVVIRVDAEGK